MHTLLLCVFKSVEFSGMWPVGLRGDVGRRDLVLHGPPLPLLVWSQESRDFAAYEAYEGSGKHLVGLPSGVLKVVVWVSQHVKKSLNQFFILSGRKEA